jgi:membrane protease YdiL (CAAX protease family)
MPRPDGPGAATGGGIGLAPGSTMASGGDVSLGRQLAAGGAPIDRSAAWTWLLFAALGFVGGQIVAVIVVSITAAVEGKTHSLTAISHLSEPPSWYIISTLVGLWAGFFGAAWLATGVKGTKSFSRDLGLRFRWVDLIGIPIGVAGQFLVALMYIPIAQHVHNFNQRFDAPSQRLTGSSHGVGYVVIGTLTVVGAPFFEELFFRGVLLRSLARLFGTIGGWVGPTLAIVITGVLFGLAHDEGLQLLGLAVFGIILSFVSYRTGRLGMNMVAHASFNLVAVLAVVTPLALGRGVLF